MPAHLYRYRPADAVLDRFHELERQQIYFSPLKDLNDPMEGFRDVVWRGDAILWTNLLRHYVRCLAAATSLVPLLGDTGDDAWFRAIHAVEQNPPDTPIRGQLDAAARAFLRQRGPRALAGAMDRRSHPVRQNELLFFLRLLHPGAMSAAFQAVRNRDPTSRAPGVAPEVVRRAGHQLAKLLGLPAMAPDHAESLFALSEFTTMQLQLIRSLTPGANPDDPVAAFLVRDFPSLYLEALSGFLYPDFYTASFVEDPTNAAMWGAYADSHKGVCLKFRTGGTPGRPTLDLCRLVGGSGSSGEMREGRAFSQLPFTNVVYGAEQPEIDFFTSLGVPSMCYLHARWFSDGKGGVSPAWSSFDDEASWRASYWRRFQAFANAKTLDWRHEAEHRLVLKSFLHPLDTVASRQLTYRFTDLAGIVFGVRTSVADKLAILKIVEAKCDAGGRKDFELHQAVYDPTAGGMRLIPLNLLTLA